jgi:inhibitor of cysteine peptidase
MVKLLLKATIAVLVALALLVGPASMASAVSWGDLDDATVESYGISLAQISRVSGGFPDGTWQPWRGITRAQFAKMACAAFAIDPVHPLVPSFSDLSPADYFYEYVEGVHLAGLMQGVGEGLFAPSSSITREQAAAVVARKVAADQNHDLGRMTEGEIAAALQGFPDAAFLSAGLRAEMAFAVTERLIKGGTSGKLNPHGSMSRIAAAALLIRAMQPRPLRLDETDNGSTVALQVGDMVEVVLKGNPTTGYGWRTVLADEDAGILQQMGEPAYVPDSGLIGAGGTYTFVFKALKAGEALLTLVYERPWESVPPLETFAVTVQVEALALDGTVWSLEGWSISSLYPGDFEITASFKDGRISGKAAVNSYSGPYSAGPGGEFTVGELASTLMAGPEPAMRAERLYFELLRQARLYHMIDGRLTLLDANGNELLIFAPSGSVLDSGIEGEVWIGPISPVSRPGDPDSEPYSAVIRIRSISDDRVLAEVTSGEDGRFRITLVPGRYLLEPQQGDPLPRASTQEVTVVAGQFTHVRIDYDSGIR